MDLMLNSALLWAMILVTMFSRSGCKVAKEFCQFDSFEGRCRDHEVILVHSAQYGRMRAGRCISGEGYIGCKSDVIKELDAMCSGRHACAVPVSDIRAVAQPCKRDYMAYLEADYKCVQVEGAKPHVCSRPEPVILSKSHGYLSSLTATETALGQADCPWTLDATPGQRLTLWVYEFGVMTKEDDESWTRPDFFTRNCPIHMVITEKDGEVQRLPLCGAGTRKRELGVSKGHQVQLHMIFRMNIENMPHFLVEYKVVGCPDLKAPPYGRISRQGDKAIIRCNTTQETWYLTCDGQKWIGDVGNCTGNTWGMQKLFGTQIPVTQGILIAVAIGVALGIVFGTSLLAAVLFCKRKRWQKAPAGPSHHQTASEDSLDRDLSTYPALLKQGNNDSGFYTGSGTMTSKTGTSILSESADDRVHDYRGSRSMSSDYYSSRRHVYECPAPPKRSSEDHQGHDPPVYFDLDPEANRYTGGIRS